MEEIKKTAFKYAIKNAYEHKGSAQVGAVVGKVKALFADADLGKVAPEVAKIVAQVNKMNAKDVEAEYKKFDAEGWELKHVEKEKTLPELEWLNKGEKIVARFAPNPSGVMHFGHARPAVLTDEFIKKFGGKLILRFDDTDPKVKTPQAGAEEEIMRDCDWLGVKFSEVSRSSDRLERYYEVIERLLKEDMAYVCSCESEKWRKLIWAKKGCKCRSKKPKEQLDQWKKMLKHEIKEGEAVVRIKTDLKNPDPSERDWWLAKEVDKINHTNKNVADKHVWPSYNLACGVDDHDMNINMIIRGQEHLTNADKQKFLFDYFKWKVPHNYFNGKISKLGDMVLSKSKIKVLMEKQSLQRDDDPRLATIKSFRRRGFRPETIRKIIFECGLSLKEVKIDMDMIAAFNKEFVGEVNDYPFIEEPVEVEVYNVAPGEGEVGGEKVLFKGPIEKILVEKKELAKYKKGDSIRMKRGFNITFEEVSEYGGKAQFVSYSKTDKPLLNWLVEYADCEILMSDGTKKIGVSSKAVLEEKGMVRFEGLGYTNTDPSEGKGKFVFAYK